MLHIIRLFLYFIRFFNVRNQGIRITVFLINVFRVAFGKIFPSRVDMAARIRIGGVAVRFYKEWQSACTLAKGRRCYAGRKISDGKKG